MLTQRTSLKTTLTRAMLLASAASCLAGIAVAQEDSGVQTTRETVGGSTLVIVKSKRFVPQGAISASKTAIPLIQTPQSVSVITRDQIDLLGFTDLQQAVRYTSGAFGENYGPDLRFDFVTVRGFTPKQYIDGLAAPVTTTISSVGVDLYAFESADILKGPSSVLYGNTPPGGLYNETSRRASSTFGGEIQAKLGSYDYKSLAGTVTGALSDSVSGRLTALYLDRGAERNGVSAKRTLLAPTATWKISSDTRLTGLAYYQYDEVLGDTNGFLPVKGTLESNPYGEVPENANLGEPGYNSYKRRQFGVGYDYSHKIADGLTFSSNAKVSDYYEHSLVIYGGWLDGDNRTVHRYNFPYEEKVESLAIDNRLEWNANTGAVTHKVLAGIDYRNVKNFAQYGFASASDIDLFAPVYSTNPSAIVTPAWVPYANQRLKQTGLYVQDHIGFGKLFLTAAGRYDTDEIEQLSGGSKTKDDAFTYRLGANYVMESGFAPYVSYSTSFEPVVGTDTSTGNAFKPSEGKQWEGGVKYDGRTLDNGVKIFATAAVYDIKQTNIVSTVYSPAFASTQVGEAEVKGFEAEFVARINEQLSINGSYTYTDSKVLKSNSPAEVGGPLPTTPKDKASIFADYTLKSGSLGGLGFGLGVRYTSKSAGSFGGGYYGQQSLLVDTAVHYDTPDWRLALNGSNITDVKYVARCSGAVGCTYGAGQSWTATLTRKF
ncbi:TonB-dependent siderophore receptor [Asticcacaulis sp. 201]|uniref:TonB-dependent siderophore receptor n=1 Tax=Asticcacaulis sp. 201 TaxID=3028787 RepID=UPI002916ACEB|nr:TonB-dependent siderophore receptor [Asticcacaulis sp. 201]MDV6330735.1 TonB-dependent siderophore receptor [Asticcacaulis sp. 201]